MSPFPVAVGASWLAMPLAMAPVQSSAAWNLVTNHMGVKCELDSGSPAIFNLNWGKLIEGAAECIPGF